MIIIIITSFLLMRELNCLLREFICLNRKHTHKNIVPSLAKWLSVRSQTTWLWVRVPLQSLKLQISCLF